MATILSQKDYESQCKNSTDTKQQDVHSYKTHTHTLKNTLTTHSFILLGLSFKYLVLFWNHLCLPCKSVKHTHTHTHTHTQ